ncbi:1650_t:CDS:2, partial [Funneliformis geosporum]
LVNYLRNQSNISYQRFLKLNRKIIITSIDSVTSLSSEELDDIWALHFMKEAEMVLEDKGWFFFILQRELERTRFSKSLEGYWNNIIKEYKIKQDISEYEAERQQDSSGEDYFLGIGGPGPNEGGSSSRRSIQYQTNSMTDNFHINYTQDNEKDGPSMPTFDHVDNISSFKQNSYNSTINGSEIAPTSEPTFSKEDSSGDFDLGIGGPGPNEGGSSPRRSIQYQTNSMTDNFHMNGKSNYSQDNEEDVPKTDNSLIQLHNVPSDLEEDEQNNRKRKKRTAPTLTRKSNTRNKERVNYYVGSQKKKCQRNKPERPQKKKQCLNCSIHCPGKETT